MRCLFFVVLRVVSRCNDHHAERHADSDRHQQQQCGVRRYRALDVTHWQLGDRSEKIRRYRSDEADGADADEVSDEFHDARAVLSHERHFPFKREQHGRLTRGDYDATGHCYDSSVDEHTVQVEGPAP